MSKWLFSTDDGSLAIIIKLEFVSFDMVQNDFEDLLKFR